MLVSSPSAAGVLTGPVGPVEPVVHNPNAEGKGSVATVEDDDDEALQLALLASLQEEALQLEAVQQASERAHAEQEERMSSVTKPPLVAKATPIAEFCKEATFCTDVTRSLEELGNPPHCLMLVKVRGDGHCLFRVVGASLVLGAAWGGRGAVDALLQHLHSPLVHTSCREVARIVSELLSHKTDALAALNDEDENGLPAQLVGALRHCAVAYMRFHAERFKHCGESMDGDGEGSWEAYCDAIEDVRKARYGGHPELVALSESLRVRVDIHDAGALSGQMATYHLGEHLPHGCPVVRGLRRGPHFNLLLQAQAEAPPALDEADEADALD